MIEQKRQILFIGKHSQVLYQELTGLAYTGMSFYKITSAQAWLSNLVRFKKSLPDIILCDADIANEDSFLLVTWLKKLQPEQKIVFALLAQQENKKLAYKAYKMGVDEIFLLPLHAADIHMRLQYIIQLKNSPIAFPATKGIVQNSGMLTFKRTIDVLASVAALVVLLPLLLMIALLIKLESKGPVLYISKRAGRNYKIFDFYKFRSMRVNAEKELHYLARLNQYQGNSTFFKIKNDPRVTKVGAFLRSTSLDELPQLVNVLKGDMSLIGNRPLPLYEAQNLTTDEWALRFLAPAGMTGLWQVSKKGGNEIFDLDRKHLDARYAIAQSLELDYKIFLKTFSAMKQYV